MVKLAPQQEAAMDIVDKRLSIGEPVTKVFGYAGTGKTTIAKELANLVSRDGGVVLFAAFTGKAASVLTRKGCPASTIHSLIYRPIGDVGAQIERLQARLVEQPHDEETQILLDEAKKQAGKPGFVLCSPDETELTQADLLVVDEVSMVGKDMGQDLLSFGTPILVLGDPAQLPPVGSEGFFTSGGEDAADCMLTDIHRQALNSPVLRLATDVRSGKKLRYQDKIVVPRIGRRAAAGFDQVLVGTNATRWAKNETLRSLRFDGSPDAPIVQGEKIICLSNNKDLGVLNGQQFYILQVEKTDMPNIVNVVMDCDCYPMGSRKDVRCDVCGWLSVRVTPMWTNGFNGIEGEKSLKEMSYFRSKKAVHATYGYAVTVHKAQGSEWDRVLVIDESRIFRKDHWRWMYTAITRAAQEVVVVK